MSKLTLNIPADIQKALDETLGKYRAMGIAIDILEVTEKGLKVRVKQIRKDTDLVLTSKELYKRASEAMGHLRTYYKDIHYLPVTWKGQEIDNVSASWVHSKMAKHHLKQADLCERLNVDKHVISKLLKSDFAFTRWHKAAFYYLFQSMEKE